MSTTKLVWIGAVLVAVVALFSLLMPRGVAQEEIKEVQAPTYEPYLATLTGSVTCLPRKDGSPPRECTQSLRVGTEYYGLDFNLMSEAQPTVTLGDVLTGTGLVTPIERLSTDHWQPYDIKAIFSITDPVTVTKAGE